MIEKEYKKQDTNNKLKEQGNKAEEQMAFYLRRAFSENKDVFVFNDIYIDYKGDTAQIDHLVLFKYGMFIIESKSCLGEISYNKYDEWKRKTKNYESGFQSPIKQVERQFDILIKNLNENTVDIFGLLVGNLKMFYGLRLKETIIGIEDHAIIKREDESSLFDSKIMKADQVSNHIKKIIKKNNLFKSLNPFLSAEDCPPPFSKKQITNLTNHIKNTDQKLRDNKEKNTNIDKINESFKTIHSCNNCNQNDFIEMKNGQYGHYFHCSSCRTNQKIKESCPICKNDNIRFKSFKNSFYLDCKCGYNKLYYTNKKK